MVSSKHIYSRRIARAHEHAAGAMAGGACGVVRVGRSVVEESACFVFCVAPVSIVRGRASACRPETYPGSPDREVRAPATAVRGSQARARSGRMLSLP